MLELSKYKDIEIAQEVCYAGEDETKVFIYNVDGLLIDTAPQSRAEVFEKWFSTQNIKQVALTHNHEDHCGNALWIQKNLNVPIYLHPKSLGSVRQAGTYPHYRQEMWGKREAFEATAMPDVLKTDKYTFEVLDTPGHALNHNCFYERTQGWLFTGDLYLGTKLFVCFYEENIRQTIATIEKLMELDFDTIFCAHAGVIENGKVRLGKKLNYLKGVQQQTIEMRAKGMSDREIDNELNGFDLPITELSCEEWSSYNIIRTI